MKKTSTRIAFSTLFAGVAIFAIEATAQGNLPVNSVPVLQYEPLANFMRLAASSYEDYTSTQFNASIQVYPFETFTGNIAEIFQRTLLRDRIGALHREENVAGVPQFARGDIPGAQMVLYASFTENIVGILRPHWRMVIVAGGAMAIVDASTNASLWSRLIPEVDRMVRTMRVVTASAPPSLNQGPGTAGKMIAGLYRGTKQKYMTGLTFQPSYWIPALHFYLFSDTGLVYRSYDQIQAPGGDIKRFDFEFARQSNPENSGRYTIRENTLYIKMGSAPTIVTPAPNGNAVTIESVTYERQ